VLRARGVFSKVLGDGLTKLTEGALDTPCPVHRIRAKNFPAKVLLLRSQKYQKALQVGCQKCRKAPAQEYQSPSTDTLPLPTHMTHCYLHPHGRRAMAERNWKRLKQSEVMDYGGELPARVVLEHDEADHSYRIPGEDY
jgi:hypothetical protein